MSKYDLALLLYLMPLNKIAHIQNLFYIFHLLLQFTFAIAFVLFFINVNDLRLLFHLQPWPFLWIHDWLVRRLGLSCGLYHSKHQWKTARLPQWICKRHICFYFTSCHWTRLHQILLAIMLLVLLLNLSWAIGLITKYGQFHAASPLIRWFSGEMTQGQQDRLQIQKGDGARFANGTNLIDIGTQATQWRNGQVDQTGLGLAWFPIT